MKKLLFSIIFLFLLLLANGQVNAADNASGSSATLITHIETKEEDNRIKILNLFLQEYNSPLATQAATFVQTADKYNLDWRLVASISGLESTFGKHQPYGSHNGWGWGYNNGNVKHFDNWEAAIEEISRGLRENYLFERTESDPYIIGPKYAASPTWAERVTYFMNRIEDYRIKNAKSTLTLTI